MGDSHRLDSLVSETYRNAGDGRHMRRMAHNPEVGGSNPPPATKARGPLSNRKRASGLSFVNRLCKRRARLRCVASTRADRRRLVLARRAVEHHWVCSGKNANSCYTCSSLATLVVMTAIPARDLRNHTAEILRRVEAGEEIEVFKDNRPVAKIIPLSRRRQWLPASEVGRELERLGPDTTGLAEELRATLTETTDDLPW